MKARLPQGMGGGPQNMQSMLRQAQKMQENIEAKKAELEEKEYVVSSGGGMVEVTANGKHEIKAIGINPEVVDRRMWKCWRICCWQPLTRPCARSTRTRKKSCLPLPAG